MSRTWEDNAVEFGALSKQGVDVRLAVLVATSVEKMEKGKGGDPETLARTSKGSANSFAKKADTTKDRVIRHLDAWVKCAAEGWCEVPKALKPEDALDPDLKVPTEEQFASKFDASSSGGRPRASISEIADRVSRDSSYAESLSEAVAAASPTAAAKIYATALETDAGRKAVATALADPETAKAVVKAASPTTRTSMVEAAVVAETEEAGFAPGGSSPAVPDPVPSWKRKIDAALVNFDDARIILNEIAKDRGDSDPEVTTGRDYYQSAIDRLFMKSGATTESVS
jgi:hypothetical protein